MAILTAQLTYDGAEFSADRETRSWTQQYLIVGDGTESSVSTAVGLPGRGSSHPSDPSAFLRSLRISRDGDSNRWTATAEYRQEPDKDIDDPCLRPWEWSRDSWTRQEPLAFAKPLLTNGELAAVKIPVVNSCGDAYSKTPTVEKHYASYKLSKCFRLGYAPDENAYIDTINSASIKLLDSTIEKWCALIKDIRSQKVNEYVSSYDAAGNLLDEYVGYVKTDMEIVFNPDNWNLKLVDAGLYCLENGTRKRITDPAGREVDADYPLDGNGGKLSQEDIDAREYVTAEYAQYVESDWSPLQLPEVR